MINPNQIDSLSEKDEIAIIGIAGRFPGAPNVDIFWQNLRDGVESINFFTDEELKAAGINPVVFNDPNYVKAGSILEDIELFDAAFFGFTPREAEIADPQHRLFLECVWEALENAGYNPENYSGQIGIYAGAALSSYLFLNLYPNREFMASVDLFQTLIGNDKDHLPTQISYKLNLRGPSVNVQTTCSTSLVAVHLACQSLLNGESDITLAGGVSINASQKTGYAYQEGGILSPDGHCRAFDANAQGTIFGNGLGVVVLKRLEDALVDGDFIHAIIKGSAINNDGSLKVGYTAPSVEGQKEVILEAIALAQVEPETITYVETHGTGTSLGDPIEIEALTQAFRSHTEEKGFCAIASVKSNVGHLNTAAGITGLIKTVQALKHQQIPPSLHFFQPNPQIDFANSPFYVNTKLAEWKTKKTPRRAGVSSFGIGGTNAHLILEEAPVSVNSNQLSVINSQSPIPSPQSPITNRPWQLLLLSAKTNSALETATANLAAHLQNNPNLNLADVAYTLQVGRQNFDYRRMVVCPFSDNLEDAIAALTTLAPASVFTQYQKPGNRSVIFMFSGQGAQYINMARELYEFEPTFRQQVNICAEILQPHLKLDLRQLLYPRETCEINSLDQTKFAQPALFVIEYSLAKLWLEWGVHPKALIGHSIGEYVAATLAGVFSLEDALTLVAARGQLMQKLPSGSMLAVPLSSTEIQSLLDLEIFSEISLAAINSPSSCVVSGETNLIKALQNKLATQGVECRILHTSHAFHSEMMQPILEPFRLIIEKLNLQPPQIPFISNVTGTWITDREATNPNYWAKHLRQTVKFSPGISELLRQAEAIFLEVGPGRTLSTLTKRHLRPETKQIVLTSLRHPQERTSDLAFLLNTVGKLFLAGVEIDWAGFYQHEKRYRVPLPTYPFERQRYWIEAKSNSFSGQNDSVSLDKKERCFVFVDENGKGSQLINKLAEKGKNVVTVKVGEQFSKLSENLYTFNPENAEDFETLFDELNLNDRSSIQEKHSRPTNLNSSYFAPTNELETEIAEMWQEVLGIKQVGIYDNFFELGGDSLVATQLISRLRAKFPSSLPLRDLLIQASTVAKQAEMIEQLLLEKIAELSDEEVEAFLAK
ncbi:type I polyketide synthase [Oscillatoria salina]|uniref:type I polyketide synthase n=1 Tax=Oscillatoria salina TaxID=331517 RepID=UPI0013BC2E92|nr:type I polyketide synthase [Oscillatoria salina]MBZ8179843.1 acyltransferase domain-containing protein [Oscillatoria salina IIICB1]NET88085.1 acyltransferase domain-containing protein [Kamptonema sp. SIO1D9]